MMPKPYKEEYPQCLRIPGRKERATSTRLDEKRESSGVSDPIQEAKSLLSEESRGAGGMGGALQQLAGPVPEVFSHTTGESWQHPRRLWRRNGQTGTGASAFRRRS